MGTTGVFEALQTMEFVQGLEASQLEKLAAMAAVVTFPEGETIFQEGMLSNKVYLIQKGQVAIGMHVPGRGRTPILTLGSGHLLGWSPLFGQERYTATARTLRPTQALAFNADQLRHVCQTDHELGCFLGWRVAQVVADRLKATRLQLLDIFGPNG
jgi:CRP-like cAMP-binding protein